MKIKKTKTMQFILPKEYDSMAKIPKPSSSKVTIKEIPPSTGIVHTFSGNVDDAKAKAKVSQMVKKLNDDGVEINESEALNSFLLWQFHPPFTLGPFKKNEVWLDLTE